MNDFHDSWYYASRNQHAGFPILQGSLSTDVCVVGGGITGLSTALHLRQKGYSVTLLESQNIGFGASGRSGGQILFGFGCEQPVIEQLIGQHNAQIVWQAGLAGVELVKSLILEHRIDCDFQSGHAHAATKPRLAKELLHWADQLRTTYYYDSLTLWDCQQMRQQVRSPRYCAGLYDSNSGHLHPLNYTLGLARAASELGVQIYEQSAALTIDHGNPATVITAEGRVSAKFLVLAGNAYLNVKKLPQTRKIMPVGTYIAATEPLGQEVAQKLIPQNIAVADTNFVLDYFRLSQDHRLLFGGKVSYSAKAPRQLKATMQRQMLKVFPQLRNTAIDFVWGGNVAITANRAPHFGRLNPNIYFAQGYSGHGMAAAGLAGRLMADAIDGDASTFDVFTRIPHRAFPGGTWLKTPALVLAMTWFRLKDLLP